MRRAAPAFVPERHDDVLLGVAIAALIAGMGVSALAVFVSGGWGSMIGFLAVFGTVGVCMIVAALTTKKPQRTALIWYITLGAVFAGGGAAYLL